MDRRGVPEIGGFAVTIPSMECPCCSASATCFNCRDQVPPVQWDPSTIDAGLNRQQARVFTGIRQNDEAPGSDAPFAGWWEVWFEGRYQDGNPDLRDSVETLERILSGKADVY